jgi:uncharacterized protein
MSGIDWKVSAGQEQTTARYEAATSGEEHSLFVCAHGAGGNMSDRGMLATANALRARGFGVVRFNFLYTEKRRGRPDSMPKLMDVVEAVVARVRSDLAPKRLLIGGRSMGGRACSMLAADGFAADGLLLLAYPLHPAGKPEQLRDTHLPRISMPVLCINGARDALCSWELMERALTTVTAPWTMHWIDGADHMFHVLKSSGRTDADVLAEIARVSGGWARRLA